MLSKFTSSIMIHQCKNAMKIENEQQQKTNNGNTEKKSPTQIRSSHPQSTD